MEDIGIIKIPLKERDIISNLDYKGGNKGQANNISL